MTLNNPTIEPVQVFELTQAQWLIGQLEKGESGTPHFQMLLWFKEKRGLRTLKKAIPEAHWEVAKSVEHAEKYVIKDDTRVDGPFEFGTRPIKRNSQTDWDQVWEFAKLGKIESIDAKIRVCHYNSLKRIEKDYIKTKHTDELRGIWLYGAPGVGKSHVARIDIGHDSCYPKLPNKWWDGYRDERVVVLEDLDHDSIKYLTNHLKIWGDRYGFIGESKGGAVSPKYDWLIITSNYSQFELMGSLDPSLYAAISRRFQQWRLDIVDGKRVYTDDDGDKVSHEVFVKTFK